MPVQRGYGGYSYYSPNGLYASSYSSNRGATPSRTYRSGAASLEDPSRSAATYRYFSRSDYYEPTPAKTKREIKTINTSELEIDRKRSPRLSRNTALPGVISRDTDKYHGGKQVVRIVTIKRRKSPYKLQEEEESLTMGQKLAMKHYLYDIPPKKSRSPSTGESEWTWETCSDSDSEGVPRTPTPPKNLNDNSKPVLAYTKSKTATLVDYEDSKALKNVPNDSPNSSINRWMNNLQSKKSAFLSKFDLRSKSEDSSRRSTGSIIAEALKPSFLSHSNSGSSSSKLSLGHKDSSKGPLDFIKLPKRSESFSSSSSPTPSPHLKRTFKSFMSRRHPSAVYSSDESETGEEGFSLGWRKGQPPRSDVVVKLSKAPLTEVHVPLSRKYSVKTKYKKILPVPTTITRVPKLSRGTEICLNVPEEIAEPLEENLRPLEDELLGIVPKEDPQPAPIYIQDKSLEFSYVEVQRLSSSSYKVSQPHEVQNLKTEYPKIAFATVIGSNSGEDIVPSTALEVRPIKTIKINPAPAQTLVQVKDIKPVEVKEVNTTSHKSKTKKKKKSKSSTESTLENVMAKEQLERVPSPIRKIFEIRSKIAAGESYIPDIPEEKPSYWNNTPNPAKPEDVNSFMQMSKMKLETAKHANSIQSEQEIILKNETDEPKDPWYLEEKMCETLKLVEHRASDHDRSIEDKRTPEENIAIIQLFGGVQFPGGTLVNTPRNLLKIENACHINCHKKCQRSMPNLCGINQKEFADILLSLDRNKSITRTGSGDEVVSPDERSSPGSPIFNEHDEPTRNACSRIPRPAFRKYNVDDFHFLKVLGKGSFGKVILSEMKGNPGDYYAIKCLKKDVVLEDDDIECTMIERKVLALGCSHPFLCHLFCTFQTNSHLFFVMEYLNGGDLMFHIQQSGRFEAERAKFYAAEIVLALKFMHRKGVVYRDLKLDNLLLDHEGHIRIADFGMCKLQIYLDRTTDTFCGTPDYMAPEIIKGLKYTYSVDWWSFGVLLYEMLIGQSPFNGCDEDELFWSICNEQAYFPRFLGRDAKHMLQLLFEKNPSKRLGSNSSNLGDVCDQQFFKSINFDKLERKEVEPVFKPKIKHSLDVSYFDSAFTKEVARLTPVEDDFLQSVNQQQFKGFSYTNANYTSN